MEKQSFQKAVEIACENGYKWSLDVSEYSILLDALFWQALVGGLANKNGGIPVVRGWEYLWHDFINHLILGKETDSFFTDLIR